jgi:hypothetical protein
VSPSHRFLGPLQFDSRKLSDISILAFVFLHQYYTIRLTIHLIVAQDRRDSPTPTGATSCHSPRRATTKGVSFSPTLNYGPGPSAIAKPPHLQLDLNRGDTTDHQTAPNPTNMTKPKQKVMMPSKRGGGGRGRGRGSSVEGGRKQSNTPALQAQA